MTKDEFLELYDKHRHNYEPDCVRKFLRDFDISYFEFMVGSTGYNAENRETAIVIKLDDSFYDVWSDEDGLDLLLMNFDLIDQNHNKQLAYTQEMLLKIRSFTEQNNND